MSRRSFRLSILCCSALVFAAACGDDGATTGSAATTTGSGSGGSASLPEPAEHRPSAEMCTGTPPAGNALSGNTGECSSDADCTAGDNGRCIWPFGGDNLCTYDQCFEDADCGAVSVCACRLGTAFDMNQCFQGSCVLDTDCGPGGYCSPSGLVSPNCMTGISPGSIGFFCHTAEDECTDDSDCGEQGQACLFQVEAMRWQCHELLCTN